MGAEWIVTGNPQADHATVEQHRQAAAAQGLAFEAQPLPTGGSQGARTRQQAPQGAGAPQGVGMAGRRRTRGRAG